MLPVTFTIVLLALEVDMGHLIRLCKFTYSMFWNQQLLNKIVSQMFRAIFPLEAWAFSLKSSSEKTATADAKQKVNG